nr:MAG TPA: hypothetical protein [Caudoviricetes sp.]
MQVHRANLPVLMSRHPFAILFDEICDRHRCRTTNVDVRVSSAVFTCVLIVDENEKLYDDHSCKFLS